MNDSEKWDRLFKNTLASDMEPEEELNQSIINRFKERTRVKSGNRKRLSVVLLVAVFTLVLSITAYAATQLLSSKEIAEHIGDRSLAEAFESKEAIEINQTVRSGDYNITLHGIVSGTGLSKFSSSAQDVNPDRTYAVVSIARQDGSPMPDTNDSEYGNKPFLVSPLIKGQKPWQVNIMSMNGGYSEIVRDGIMYRLIECDGVEIFADRGVYMAVSSDRFYNNQSFTYNEDTGEISPKADAKGISVIFDLPLDKSKSDSAKAEAYLQELLKEPSVNTTNEKVATDDKDAELTSEFEQLKKKIPDGTVIPESVKEVTYDDKGLINYEYNDWKVKISPDQLFAEGQTGISDAVSISGDEGKYMALQFSRDEHGVITGKVIDLN
ncbi:hypothetical protein E0485_19075 [Paenibacillus albiflavus]|uniref:DUF4179 domain-containing protein n=1 Tax=Paenibacillus albiflavus TaxID=2545760 RepID=A0A4V2WND5_9BACL|nr:hypothetical protein [Paenibacillus albiflavus]TCZ75092.1 hypothetical protein E0485_19075 [Paenibacillus albiflavus]